LLRSEPIAVTGPTMMLLDSGWVPGEQAFVPAQGARGEDEGWLLSIVTHQTVDARGIRRR
jgi:carotenoid cleavage dioxygenase-like enzyme